MNAVAIAPGASLTAEQCEAVRGLGVTVCAGDAYRLAPWCDAVVSTDRAWWSARADAVAMTCRKFTVHEIEGIERVSSNDFVGTGSSSGVLAMWVAKMLGATRILMIGFDNKGAHFFGNHKPPLKNTPPHRFKVFEHQFVHLRNRFKLDKIDVRNCTPDTALQAFTKATIAEGIEWLSPSKFAA